MSCESLLWLSEEAELVSQFSHPSDLLFLRKTLQLVELLAGKANLLLKDSGPVLACCFLALELLVSTHSVVIVHIFLLDEGSVVALRVFAIFVGQLDDATHKFHGLRGQCARLCQLILQEVKVLIGRGSLHITIPECSSTRKGRKGRNDHTGLDLLFDKSALIVRRYQIKRNVVLSLLLQEVEDISFTEDL